MIVVADSTPLIALARVGRLELLRDVFGRVIVPDAVWRETVQDGQGQSGASEISAASWIERRTLGDAAHLAEHLNVRPFLRRDGHGATLKSFDTERKWGAPAYCQAGDGFASVRPFRARASARSFNS